MKLSDAEWKVLQVLWNKDVSYLGEIVEQLYHTTKWTRNTVHTYLTRMEKKGLVKIDRNQEPHLYSSLISKDECTKMQREDLLNRVYQGSVSDLIAAFLKESHISSEEKEKLNKILDEMEV